jgi:hypothetical protein
VKHTLKFKIAKETKGALQYKEVDTDGHGTSGDYVVGTLYLRKSAVDGTPADLTVTVEY